MSSHPGGRKTSSCSLTDNPRKAGICLTCVASVRMVKGWEGRGGGRGGVIKFDTMGLVED